VAEPKDASKHIERLGVPGELCLPVAPRAARLLADALPQLVPPLLQPVLAREQRLHLRVHLQQNGDVACESGLPSEGRPVKRHRAAAAGSSGGVEDVVTRAALGAAEAEARFAGDAVDEDDDEGGARGALRRLGVRNADPRFAAALAHERAHFAEQARSSQMCAVVGCAPAACSRAVSCAPDRE